MNWVEPIKNRDKIARIKDNLRKKPRDYLLFVLGINVALRGSDLLQLRVRDVLEENGSTRDQIVIVESKRNKRRVISLSDSAKDAINFYFDDAGILMDDDFLFWSQKNHDAPISRTQAYRLIKKWCAEVGLTGNYGTHSLPKTWGFWAYKEGVSIDVIRKQFGHSTKKETLAYLGMKLDDVAKRVSL